MRVVCHWTNGAYISTLCDEFDKLYKELYAQFGSPAIARVHENEEEMTIAQQTTPRDTRGLPRHAHPSR